MTVGWIREYIFHMGMLLLHPYYEVLRMLYPQKFSERRAVK